jgi:hypothetical protein
MRAAPPVKAAFRRNDFFPRNEVFAWFAGFSPQPPATGLRLDGLRACADFPARF